MSFLDRINAAIQSFFGRRRGEKQLRKPGEATMMRQAAKRHVQSFANGGINCPFCDDHQTSLEYDKKTNSFRCNKCKRNGAIDTLQRRLDDAEAYLYSVQ